MKLGIGGHSPHSYRQKLLSPVGMPTRKSFAPFMGRPTVTYSGERRLCPYLREAALAPDATPYPYIDARRPPPGADPYGQPLPPPQRAVRAPSATLHSAAPRPQLAHPDADAGRPPSDDTGRLPPYSTSTGCTPPMEMRRAMTKRGLRPRGQKDPLLLGKSKRQEPLAWRPPTLAKRTGKRGRADPSGSLVPLR